MRWTPTAHSTGVLNYLVAFNPVKRGKPSLLWSLFALFGAYSLRVSLRLISVATKTRQAPTGGDRLSVSWITTPSHRRLSSICQAPVHSTPTTSYFHTFGASHTSHGRTSLRLSRAVQGQALSPRVASCATVLQTCASWVYTLPDGVAPHWRRMWLFRRTCEEKASLEFSWRESSFQGREMVDSFN